MGNVATMKMIFKIEEYLPETKQVVIRYCRQNSPKPISEYPAKAVSTEIYDVSFDSRNLVESISQYGYDKVLFSKELLNCQITEELENNKSASKKLYEFYYKRKKK